MLADSNHSDTAAVLLGLSSGTAQSPSRAAGPSAAQISPREAKASASGSAVQSYALLAAAKRQTQAAALPRKEWSPHEDELIRRGVEQLGCRWRVIAAQLPGRSDDAVRNRWSRLQDTAKSRTGGRDGGVKRSCGASASDAGGTEADATGAAAISASGSGGSGGSSAGPASADGPTNGGGGGGTGGGGLARTAETAALSVLVGRRGSGDGSAARIKSPASSGGGGGGGSGSGFRKERSSWTRAEDDVIVQGVSELGHKWFEIARRLPGRTDHAIRNRWSRLQSILLQQEAQHGYGSAAPQPSPHGLGHGAVFMVPSGMAAPGAAPGMAPGIAPGIAPAGCMPASHTAPYVLSGAPQPQPFAPQPPPPLTTEQPHAPAADAGSRGQPDHGAAAAARTVDAKPSCVFAAAAAAAQQQQLQQQQQQRQQQQQVFGSGGRRREEAELPPDASPPPTMEYSSTEHSPPRSHALDDSALLLGVSGGIRRAGPPPSSPATGSGEELSPPPSAASPTGPPCSQKIGFRAPATSPRAEEAAQSGLPEGSAELLLLCKRARVGDASAKIAE